MYNEVSVNVGTSGGGGCGSSGGSGGDGGGGVVSAIASSGGRCSSKNNVLFMILWPGNFPALLLYLQCKEKQFKILTRFIWAK